MESRRWLPVRALLDPGVQAFRQNWRPFLLIQAATAVLVWFYYRGTLATALLNSAADLKARNSLVFVPVSSILVGVIVPEIAKALSFLGSVRLPTMGLLLTSSFFFASKGVYVDALYLVLDHIFGGGRDLGTVIVKTLIDQFISTPLVTIPYSAATFFLYRHGFSAANLRVVFSRGFFRSHCMPLLAMCWVFWLPIVFVSYCLPIRVQFILNLLSQASWALLLVFVTVSHTSSPPPNAEAAPVPA